MRTRRCSIGGNVLFFVSGVFLAFLNSAEPSDSQTSPDLIASLEPSTLPLKHFDTITFSGTDMFIMAYRPIRGVSPRVETTLTVFRADGTSHTLDVDNELWSCVMPSEDILYTLEVAHSRSPSDSPERAFLVREYNLKSGNARSLVQPQSEAIEAIHLYGNTLYLIGRGYDSAGGDILTIRTLPPGGGDRTSSYSVSTMQIGPPKTVRIGKYRPFGGALYCFVTSDPSRPGGTFYRLDFGSQEFVKVLEVPSMLDFCIVSDGPRLAYLHDDSTDPSEPSYALTLVPLDGKAEKPVTANLDRGKSRFGEGLQYDPNDRAFIVKGSLPPHDARSRSYYHIRVSKFSK